MRKILAISTLWLVSTSFSPNTDTKVYICKGKYSKKYHYNNSCPGLSNCSTNIYEVSLTEAKNLGRTLCGRED